jgi:hypothetical protein
MLFPMLNAMYFYISTYWSMSEVANMAVSASSLVLCFFNMLLRYVLYDFGMVWAAPIVTVEIISGR